MTQHEVSNSKKILTYHENGYRDGRCSVAVDAAAANVVKLGCEGQAYAWTDAALKMGQM